VHTRVLLIAGGSIVAAAALLAGCGANSADVQQLNQNQFTLRGMIASDRQQIDSLQVQVRRLRDEIAELKHAGTTQGPGAGQMGSVNDRLAKLETEVNAMQAAMPTIPTAPPAGAAALPAPATPPAAGAHAAPVAPAEPAPTWPQELESELQAAKKSRAPGAKLYREGLLEMKSGNYPSAIVKFARLQHNYPKSPLSEPAEYFAANALYESGKPDRAILQFNDLVMRFPRGRFTSQALLREAEAFLKLDDKIDARLTLQKLIADHGGTPQATAAAHMMKTLVAD
jgi:TolA-binding protein